MMGKAITRVFDAAGDHAKMMEARQLFSYYRRTVQDPLHPAGAAKPPQHSTGFWVADGKTPGVNCWFWQRIDGNVHACLLSNITENDLDQFRTRQYCDRVEVECRTSRLPEVFLGHNWLAAFQL